MAAVQHRRQSFLEGLFMPSRTPLLPSERAPAKHGFYAVILHSEFLSNAQDYNRAHAIHAHTRSLNHGDEIDLNNETLQWNVFSFADALLGNFFLPLKASPKETAQPSLASHNAIKKAQGGSHEFTQSKQIALRVLGMLNDGVTHFIDGQNIDGPYTAMALDVVLLHGLVGDFEISFTHIDGHTYRIESFLLPYYPEGYTIPALFTSHADSPN
ncbi:hypothetical protein BBP40_004784 [Aspergillus hancockii]|nr:hypothetical protein BBP40_004784 [Aspergillus hancockii]